MRFRSLLLLAGLALGAVMLAGPVGCVTDPGTGKTTVDPAAVADTADDLADLAELFAVVVTKPGPDQDKLIAEIEVARKLGDSAALRRILDRVRGQPPATPPAASSPSSS